MNFKKELLAMAAAGALVMTPAWAFAEDEDRAQIDQQEEQVEIDREGEDDVALFEEDEDTEQFAPFDEERDEVAEDDWAVETDDEMAEVEPPVSDELILQLQQALNQEGQDIAEDGIWGPETEEALSQYQQDQGIDATGQLDAETLAQLNLDEEGDVAMAEEEQAEVDEEDDDTAFFQEETVEEEQN
ncbi:hypothetical protein CAI21_11510 [Alkalilimnicola ehrlichii]|uniref:Peptidoglycan binding-like domain-containing protein n=1 Tax=Alkalilimnicola ehrlichii TaxID=351052 RepID=A0A3E0WJ02_9GAMM|nr:peptidoglycan-binding domain-containing protein [Alkalilimnicola ehrlichii]RFA29058.1 hypothetical protein CAI21_11510 [Alkalilimnicola ehrlichii]RFA31845.1 hypothetical protein CAL65_21335 [Alkalilimnicola ehrlichii]